MTKSTSGQRATQQSMPPDPLVSPARLVSNRENLTIDASDAGGFVVSWTTQSTSGRTVAVTQHYDAAGDKSGSATQIELEPTRALTSNGQVLFASGSKS